MKKKNKSEQECKAACAKKTSIGGQALIEGIMMRGPKKTAMAVRNTSGEIVLEKWDTVTKKVPKILKLPLIRGVYGFISSLTVGYKALMRSAEISGLEELDAEIEREKQEKKAAKKAAKEAKKQKVKTEEAIPEAKSATIDQAEAATADANADTVADTAEEIPSAPISEEAQDTAQATEEKTDTPKKKKEASGLSSMIMVISTVLAVVIAVALFFWMPTELYKFLSTGFKIKGELALPFLYVEDRLFLNSLFKSVFEGFLRIAMLVGYMAAVSLLKDIRKTFQYHGAEHKTIFCYENGLDLTVENVRKQKRFHPRCGTAFLVLMLLVGICVSFFIDPAFILILGHAPATWLRVIVKLLTTPFVMGIGYELIKIAGRHDNIITRIISAPGLWLQRLTVLEPTDDMIECAITAFEEVIPDDGKDNY